MILEMQWIQGQRVKDGPRPCAVCWRTDPCSEGGEHGAMKPTVSPLTAIYTEWLGAFRSLLPGGWYDAPAPESTPKAAHTEAVQEWEDEGGAIKPAAPKQPGKEPETKIPF